MNNNETKKTAIEILVKRLGNLASVKSIVTLVLTAVFAYLSCSGGVSQEFMSIYTMIMGFYFGTQATKGEG